MTLHPYTEKDAQEQARKERTSAINTAGFQLDMLREGYRKHGGVSHGLFHRLVQSLIKVGRHIPVVPEDAERFEKSMRNAGEKQFTVNVQGNTVYLEGYFNLSELRKGALW